jgi:hypothetical protein
MLVEPELRTIFEHWAGNGYGLYSDFNTTAGLFTPKGLPQTDLQSDELKASYIE